MKGIPCTWMRGGTSKGAYFLADDLPDDPSERDALMLSIMGSPDSRQIDGIGGADPLTSKVAIVSTSERANVDLDYLFLQVFVDEAIVTDKQNCGNILAGVGQFAIEKNLVTAKAGETTLSVYMVNSDQVATVSLETPQGEVVYSGDTRIDGVPGTASRVLENFPEAAGANCGSLLPTGNVFDVVDGVEVTCIDNGMPVVVVRASDVGVTGYESRQSLDDNSEVKARLESIRLQVGPKMGLGNVEDKSVPKMTLVARPKHGGTISTRTFIPHRCHASIGVLGAVSVATACMLPGSPAADLADLAEIRDGTDGEKGRDEDTLVLVEHPLGETGVVMQVNLAGDQLTVTKAAIVRTARKLFEGLVFPK